MLGWQQVTWYSVAVSIFSKVLRHLNRPGIRGDSICLVKRITLNIKRSEVKRSVCEILTTWTGKTEAFTKLSGPGVKSNQLALFIASYAYPEASRMRGTSPAGLA